MTSEGLRLYCTVLPVYSEAHSRNFLIVIWISRNPVANQTNRQRMTTNIYLLVVSLDLMLVLLHCLHLKCLGRGAGDE